MTNKATKYGLMTIAAVLLVAMAFAGGASADYTYSGGSGTENDPYMINTALDLYNLTQDVDKWDELTMVYFKLGADIYVSDIQSLTQNPDVQTVTISSKSRGDVTYNYSTAKFTTKGWIPEFDAGVVSINPSISSWPSIGNSSNGVTGNLTLDGDNHKIYGLFINISGGKSGIFGYINSSAVVNVTCLNLENSVIYNGGSAGGLLGESKDSAKVNLTKCKITNCLIGAVGGCEGGLVGISRSSSTLVIDSCNVTNCIVNGLSGYIGGIIGGGYCPLSLDNCFVKDSSVFDTGTNGAGGLVGTTSGKRIWIANCSVLNSVIKSMVKVGGIGGYLYQTNFDKFEFNNVTNCIIEGDGLHSGAYSEDTGVGGLIGQNRRSTMSAANCNVSSCWIGSRSMNVGGLVGSVGDTSKADQNNIDGISNCSVKNCVIKTEEYRAGGLVGCVAGKMDNVTDSMVVNCTILGGANRIGGLVGYTGSANNWHDNNVINCAINGTDDRTNYVCGNLPGLENANNCTVTGMNYIRNLSATEPQPLIVAKMGVASVSHAKAIVTRLSGVGTLSNPQNALGYVIDDAQVEFNPNLGSAEVYSGTIEVGAHTVDLLYAAGYTFNGWNLSSVYGTMLTDATGTLQNSVSGYTNATGYWNNATETLVELYANWTVNTTTSDSVNNVSAFGNGNATAIKSTGSTLVSSVVLESVSNVTGTVTFTADNTDISDSFPSISGRNTPVAVSIFNITAVNDQSGKNSKIYLNITLSSLDDKDNVFFFHHNGAAWDGTPLAKSVDSVSGNTVKYAVETTSFSPFGIVIATPASSPAPSYSSSSKQTGYTVILQEGQTAPTAYATATPTAAPTAAPTEQPATPTVIATAKPTTQPTQASPAPFLGILAGLGAAALVLGRLRR